MVLGLAPGDPELRAGPVKVPTSDPLFCTFPREVSSPGAAD